MWVYHGISIDSIAEEDRLLGIVYNMPEFVKKW